MILEFEDSSLKAPRCKASHLRPLILGHEKIRRVSSNRRRLDFIVSLPRLHTGETSNSAPDYVFVDEHNRHKRLKGTVLIRFPVLFIN